MAEFLGGRTGEKTKESNQSDGERQDKQRLRARGESLGPRQRYTGRAGFKALLHSLRQSFLMKQQRLDAPVFEFWYLVGDDLRQHLREFHTEGFIHKGVEADLEKTLDHLGRDTRHRQINESPLDIKTFCFWLICRIIF